MRDFRLGRAEFSAFRPFLVFFLMLGLIGTMISPAFAAGGLTGTVSGTITDDAGVPVSAVQVAATSPSGAYRTTTDGTGHFQIAGVTVDTYTISFEKQGFEPYSLTGVTVIGDQSVGLGTIKFSRSLKTIGRVSSRSASSAFQPTSTQDTFVFSGQKVTQALGKTFATNQDQLIAASPGTQIDKAGNIVVRGSLSTEVGYNYDGIDYRSVSHGGAANADNGNTGVLAGIGSLSVNPGAGDSSVSNGGAGIINLIPKRGTRPGFGTLDFETGVGPYDHQFGAEYGFATPDGKISNYVSFLGRNNDLQYGPVGQSVQGAQIGSTGISNYNVFNRKQSTVSRTLVDNLFYKFGKNNNQSLQFLFQNDLNESIFPTVAGQQYAVGNPLTSFFTGFEDALIAQLPKIGPLVPGQTALGQQAPANSDHNQTNLLKLEYNNNINASTFLALRLYRVNQYDVQNDYNGVIDGYVGARTPNTDGGGRTGLITELTKTLGSNNQLTLSTQYELDRAVFGINDPIAGIAVVDGPNAGFSVVNGGNGGRTDWQDFVTPNNTSAPLTFGGGTGPNDCPVAQGCWLYYINTTPTINGQKNPDFGFFKHGIPRIPSNTLVSPPNPAQFYGIGLRDQIAVGRNLHIDAGLRYEGENYHFPNGLDTGNIGPDKKTNSPTELEPKLSAAYSLGPQDSIRAGYGRSAIFVLPGNADTPLAYSDYQNNFPHGSLSLPNYTPAGTDYPTMPIPARCGSGEGGGTAVPFRACTSYADMLRWEEDYFFPDNGNARTQTYNNFEFSYAHQFKSGFAAKLTPFYRQGYEIPFLGVAAFTVDPTSGAINPTAFRPFYDGFSKSTGAEFFLTAPDRKYGFGGYLSATYVNALSNKPAGASAEDSQPLVPFQVLAANNTYRVGFLSPFVANLGVDYKFKNGLRIAPVFRYNRGFPFGVGNLTPVTLNGKSFNVPSTNNLNSVVTNDSLSGTARDAVNFIDPTNPGNLIKPNLYATRGAAEAPSPGGILSRPRLTTDLTVELKAGHSTFGIQAQNLTNIYDSQPTLNTRYQSIATGVPGAQTGQISRANPANSSYATFAQTGVYNYTAAQNGRGAYLVSPNLNPTIYRLYYQLGL